MNIHTNCSFSDDEYLTIRNDPIVIPDPLECQNPTREITPKPFLRRGSGLQRYQMSVGYFKQGPPDLYKKDEFKSVRPVFQKKSLNKAKASLKTCRPCPTATAQPVSTLPARHFSERKYAIDAVKCFDDEVIPSLRSRAHHGCEVNFDNIQGISRLTSDKPTIPKTPIKRLILKPTGNDVFVDERNEHHLEHGIDIDIPTTVTSDESDSDVPARYQERTDNIVRKNSQFRLSNPPENVGGEPLVGTSHRHLLSDDDHSDDLNINKQQRCKQEVAMALKRKGLTDNVKKHLAWNVTPRKKRITKLIKIKKPKPVVKKEKYTIHEFKHRLALLLEENKKLQAENYKMKLKEKELSDEKIKIQKMKKEQEYAIKSDREQLEEEKFKLLEDQKKLKREKLAFDRYCQEARNLPSREDRELIRNLKEEILKMKEEQKTKDIRVGAAQAQLRNRVVFLEKENKDLRKDLEMTQNVKKVVRFDTVGNIRNKVINAINDHLDGNVKKTRPRSAGEKATATSKPLRRTKSAIDIKPKGSTERRKCLNEGKDTRDDEKNKEGIHLKTTNYCNEYSIESSAPEVIDLVGEMRSSQETTKRDDADSGVGSRYSSENSPTRSSVLLGGVYGSEVLQPSRDFVEINDKKSDDPNTCNFRFNIHQRNEVDCQGCMPSDWIKPASEIHRHLHWDKTKSSLDITTESSIANPIKGSNNLCVRHGYPIVPDMDKSRSCLVDRDVVRTRLVSGDVEEEELHTGVRRVTCGACSAVEISYRNRPGYRRTHLPQDEVLEEHTNGVIELRRKNGEILRKYPNGDRLLILPNGDKEFTTRGYKKLETVNGTVKIVFDNGRTETRYRSGRVRVKDENGHLIMDTGGL